MGVLQMVPSSKVMQELLKPGALSVTKTKNKDLR